MASRSTFRQTSATTTASSPAALPIRASPVSKTSATLFRCRKSTRRCVLHSSVASAAQSSKTERAALKGTNRFSFRSSADPQNSSRIRPILLRPGVNEDDTIEDHGTVGGVSRHRPVRLGLAGHGAALVLRHRRALAADRRRHPPAAEGLTRPAGPPERLLPRRAG